MPLYNICRCGIKVEYPKGECLECKSNKELEKKQKYKKYNSDRYTRDKENNSYRLFYNSKDWTKKRIEVLDRDNHECQLCRSLCKISVATDVHHILNLKNNYELRLANDNLCSLCNECHKLIHRLELNSKDKIDKYIKQRQREDKFIKNLIGKL